MTSSNVPSRNQNGARLAETAPDVMPVMAGARVQMGIADMSILSELSNPSSHPGYYVARELWSNAYDACVAAGVIDGGDIVIDVTLDVTRDVPLLVVSDHGVGMTPDEVALYFLQYGASNKRSDKDMVGSKGLGSKAPLSICDAFVVRSTRDGLTTTARPSRIAGSLSEASVSTEVTDLPNGTTVSVPIMNPKYVEQADSFFSHLSATLSKRVASYNGQPIEPALAADHVGQTFHPQPIAFPDESQAMMTGDGKTSGSQSATYLGRYKLGDDDVRMWMYPSFRDGVPTSALVEMLCGSVAEPSQVVVCINGAPYWLQGTRNGYARSWFSPYRWTLVVELKPGYLNFDTARDEIRDDGAKHRVRRSLGDLLKQCDRSKLYRGVLEHASMRGAASLLDNSDQQAYVIGPMVRIEDAAGRYPTTAVRHAEHATDTDLDVVVDALCDLSHRCGLALCLTTNRHRGVAVDDHGGFAIPTYRNSALAKHDMVAFHAVTTNSAGVDQIRGMGSALERCGMSLARALVTLSLIDGTVDFDVSNVLCVYGRVYDDDRKAFLGHLTKECANRPIWYSDHMDDEDRHVAARLGLSVLSVDEFRTLVLADARAKREKRKRERERCQTDTHLSLADRMPATLRVMHTTCDGFTCSSMMDDIDTVVRRKFGDDVSNVALLVTDNNVSAIDRFGATSSEYALLMARHDALASGKTPPHDLLLLGKTASKRVVDTLRRHGATVLNDGLSHDVDVSNIATVASHWHCDIPSVGDAEARQMLVGAALLYPPAAELSDGTTLAGKDTILRTLSGAMLLRSLNLVDPDRLDPGLREQMLWVADGIRYFDKAMPGGHGPAPCEHDHGVWGHLATLDPAHPDASDSRLAATMVGIRGNRAKTLAQAGITETPELDLVHASVVFLWRSSFVVAPYLHGIDQDPSWPAVKAALAVALAIRKVAVSPNTSYSDQYAVGDEGIERARELFGGVLAKVANDAAATA